MRKRFMDWLRFEYEAKCVTSPRWYRSSSKRVAVSWAKKMNGEWTVYRIWPTGWRQKIKTYGGTFDEWPGGH